MIRAEAFLRGRLFDKPFSWGLIEGVLAEEDVLRLARAFPQDGFEFSTRSDDDKQYALKVRPFPLDPSMRVLPSPWPRLADEIVSDEYRSLIEQISRRSLKGARVEAAFWRYGPDCWLGPHLDKPEKIVSQIIYLNEVWDPRWGGGLRILRSENPEEIASEISPRLNRSVLIVRSDRSWHMVAPVQPGVSDRLSLQIVFYSV